MQGESIDFAGGDWLNRPPALRLDNGVLEVETAEGSDFWRRTHYGFEHASGHALLSRMSAVFAAEITFSGTFANKYEQAGLMLWEDETRWIKAGVEFADGRANLATVVTRERSDWSMAPAAPDDREWRLRVTSTGSAVIVHVRGGTGRWQILRVADFIAGEGVRLGPMACSPLSAALRVRFSDFRRLPVPEDPLYIG